MTKPFDPTKPVQTRDGRKARIICTDLKRTDGFEMVVLLDDPVLGEYARYYHSDGCFSSETKGENDLVNVATKHVRWMNIYTEDLEEYTSPSGVVSGIIETFPPSIGRGLYYTKDDAVKQIKSGEYITTVKIEWEE